MVTAKVPPDAVRVWRGFKLETLSPKDFLAALGSIFIPATAQLQRLYGLTAYLPTVLPLDKPNGVPDEIALVFYRSQKAYDDTKLTVPGRAYSSLHSTVFGFPQSESGFPGPLGDRLKFDTPYCRSARSRRLDERRDPGLRRDAPGRRDEPDLCPGPCQIRQGIAAAAPQGPRRRGAPCHRRLGSVLGALDERRRRTQRQQAFDIAATGEAGPVAALPRNAQAVKLTARYAGITVRGGESFNVRFPRNGGTARSAHSGA